RHADGLAAGNGDRAGRPRGTLGPAESGDPARLRLGGARADHRGRNSGAALAPAHGPVALGHDALHLPSDPAAGLLPDRGRRCDHAPAVAQQLHAVEGRATGSDERCRVGDRSPRHHRQPAIHQPDGSPALQNVGEQGRQAEVEAMLQWVNEKLPNDGICASLNPALVYLYTGRKTISGQELIKDWEAWQRMDVRYLVLTSPYGVPERDSAGNKINILYQSKRDPSVRVFDLGSKVTRA